METKDLLVERGKTHGNYSTHAWITQHIKTFMHNAHKITPASDTPIPCWECLTVEQRESLDMIAHKIGRILAGDSNFRDHWDDIAGYAKLVADRCIK
jgi:hypothetical protein